MCREFPAAAVQPDPKALKGWQVLLALRAPQGKPVLLVRKARVALPDLPVRKVLRGYRVPSVLKALRGKPVL